MTTLVDGISRLRCLGLDICLGARRIAIGSL